MVRVRVKPGRGLSTPDGRIIGPGEVVELPDGDARFAVIMDAGEIVTDHDSPAPKKPKADAKDAKT